MGAVTGGVGQILSGRAAPEVGKSLAGFAAAFDYIEVDPWHTRFPLLALMICGAVVAVRYSPAMRSSWERSTTTTTFR